MSTKEFYSSGKLLITGEYAVLDGALSLAVPTRFGQALKVSPIASPTIEWKSLDQAGKIWFEWTYQTENLITDDDKALENDTAKTLLKLIREAKKLNQNFLIGATGYNVESRLEFPRNWGLGSSSTLINNIAQWAEVDPFELLWNAFTGSGYDIACAQTNSPLTYKVLDQKPLFKAVDFSPTFSENLFFIHLDKKQNSREGIARYRDQKGNKKILTEQISSITEDVLKCSNLKGFEFLIEQHEKLISEYIRLPTVKAELFSDYFGTLKSLGAWGGDFILATGNEQTPAYFRKKGYRTVLSYKEMIA
ncbi:GYDIA family GHMP kinase [Pseudozobellia sp. WGM2]|uniref:GYDIA family GHMP kinase n=1 Tax=Pseudozobellia sp. WGM2 TaxID=2787625 RepID=UPI001AE0ACBC